MSFYQMMVPQTLKEIEEEKLTKSRKDLILKKHFKVIRKKMN